MLNTLKNSLGYSSCSRTIFPPIQSFLNMSRQERNFTSRWFTAILRPVKGTRYSDSRQSCRQRQILLADSWWQTSCCWLSSSLRRSSRVGMSKMQRAVVVLMRSQSRGMLSLTLWWMMLRLMSEVQEPSGLRKQEQMVNSEAGWPAQEKQARRRAPSSVFVVQRQLFPSLSAPSFRFTPYSFRIYISSSKRLSPVSFSVLRVKEQRHSSISFWLKPKELSVRVMQSQGCSLSGERKGRRVGSGWRVVLGWKARWMLVAERLRLLSMSSPMAEKGQLMQEAMRPMIQELKKVREVSRASNFMFMLLSLGVSSFIPYSYRHILHTRASMKSIFRSMNSTHWLAYRLLPVPPIRYIFSLIQAAQNPQAAWGASSIACHSRVSTLKQSTVLQKPITPRSLGTSPPTRMTQGLSRGAKTATGEPRGVRWGAWVETVRGQISMHFYLKSVKRNEQIWLSGTTYRACGSKVSPVRRKPRPPCQKMRGLRVGGRVRLVSICVQRMLVQSRMCQSLKKVRPLLPPITMRYLFLKKQEVWYSRGAGRWPVCGTSSKASPVKRVRVFLQTESLGLSWRGALPAQKQIWWLWEKREKPWRRRALRVGTTSTLMVQQSSLRVTGLYSEEGVMPPKMRMWCWRAMTRWPMRRQCQFLTGQQMNFTNFSYCSIIIAFELPTLKMARIACNSAGNGIRCDIMRQSYC